MVVIWFLDGLFFSVLVLVLVCLCFESGRWMYGFVIGIFLSRYRVGGVTGIELVRVWRCFFVRCFFVGGIKGRFF